MLFFLSCKPFIACFILKHLIDDLFFCFLQREGFSVFNKIYEFDMMLNGERCKMRMTSVSGHLLNHEFCGNYRKWFGCNPVDLFDAPIIKECSQRMQPIQVWIDIFIILCLKLFKSA